jgi:hypothetical protein
MKTIKSNKIGKNIHSPFIYRLVAHGLCAPYPFYAFAEIDKMGLGKDETERLKMLFRLLNFLELEEVNLIGNNTEIYSKVIRFVRTDMKITHSEKYNPVSGNFSRGTYDRLVIFDSADDGSQDYPLNPEIWLLTDLMKKDLQKLFTGLKFVDEARVTIEINRIGIIIFNWLFEKQDYVINP